MAANDRVRFGGRFELDSSRRLLLRDGASVHLSPKAFLLLSVLLERFPAAVDRRELHERIWPDTFVSESTLAGVATELRAALGDDARSPELIRTVHGFGYAFVGDVPAAEGHAFSRFRVMVLGRDVPLQRGDNVIGRASDAAVFVDDVSVSRQHASIVVAEDAILHDRGSKNGTFLNGERVMGPKELRNRDVIGVGSLTVTFFDAGSSESTMTVQRDAGAG
jgi:DNA-binding winged helix-turn-helix (wHTH) protein